VTTEELLLPLLWLPLLLLLLLLLLLPPVGAPLTVEIYRPTKSTSACTLAASSAFGSHIPSAISCNVPKAARAPGPATKRDIPRPCWGERAIAPRYWPIPPVLQYTSTSLVFFEFVETGSFVPRISHGCPTLNAELGVCETGWSQRRVVWRCRTDEARMDRPILPRSVMDWKYPPALFKKRREI